MPYILWSFDHYTLINMLFMMNINIQVSITLLLFFNSVTTYSVMLCRIWIPNPYQPHVDTHLLSYPLVKPCSSLYKLTISCFRDYCCVVSEPIIVRRTYHVLWEIPIMMVRKLTHKIFINHGHGSHQPQFLWTIFTKLSSILLLSMVRSKHGQGLLPKFSIHPMQKMKTLWYISHDFYI